MRACYSILANPLGKGVLEQVVELLTRLIHVVDHLETYPKLIQGSKWQWSATVCFGVLQYVSTCLTFFPMLQSAQLLKSIGHFMGVMENQVEIIGNPEKINALKIR